MSLSDLDINTARVMALGVSRRVGSKAMFGRNVEGAEDHLTPTQYRLKLYLATFEHDHAWDKRVGDMNPSKIAEIRSALVSVGINKEWWLPGMPDENCEQAWRNLTKLKGAQ